MAKRGWMPENLRLCRNLLMTLAFAAPLSACVTGTLGFDIIINGLIGKNVDFFVLGPGYYYHPNAKMVRYSPAPKAKILRENSEDITYKQQHYTCAYEMTVDKRTRLLKSWRIISEDRSGCNVK